MFSCPVDGLLKTTAPTHAVCTQPDRPTLIRLSQPPETKRSGARPMSPSPPVSASTPGASDGAHDTELAPIVCASKLVAFHKPSLSAPNNCSREAHN